MRARMLLHARSARLVCSRTHRSAHVICAQEFFRDVKVDGSLQHKWYQGIKTNMGRLITQRKRLDGSPMDQSAEELFLCHVRAMSAGLACADTAEAATRKFAIKTIWRAAGRASEPADLNYNSLKWNALFQTAVIESIQSKVGKFKFVMFPAGQDRHADWLLGSALEVAAWRAGVVQK